MNLFRAPAREFWGSFSRIATTSAVTAIEIASVLWRRRHAAILTLEDHQRAEYQFAQLSARWREISYSRAIVEAAFALLARRSLRALDAIQLASALTLAPIPAELPFVTLDQKLIAAARAEGFPVLP